MRKLQKLSALDEKRREKLPLELKQKVSYDILQKLRDLGENTNTTEQQGSIALFCGQFDTLQLLAAFRIPHFHF